MSFVVSRDKPLGDYRAIYLARATDEEIRKRRVGSGGAVTSMLIYMLEKGIIDAVVAAKKRRGLEGEIAIARNRDEVLRVAGDRWSILPFTAKLKDSLMEEDINSVAIVCLPCQAQFLRQMKLYPLLETDFSRKIYMIISLFCMGTYATEAFLNFLKMMYGMDPEDIINIQLRGQKITIVTTKEKKELSTSEVLPYTQLGCLTCPDYTGIFADISVGISENNPNYTVLISRTDIAEQIISGAERGGYIEIRKGGPDLVDEIELRAQAKLIRAVKYASMLL